MPERATTTTLRRLTLESGDQGDMPQREMASGTVETLAPMLERALAGDPQVRIPPTDYWFRARQLASGGTPDDALRVEFGTVSVGDVAITEMTVRPPATNGDPAILMTSIGGWLQAVAAGSLGSRPAADRIAYEISGLENGIAWTWLEMRGYATRFQNLTSPLEVLFSAGGGMLTTVVQEPGQSPEVCVLVQNSPDAVGRLSPDPQISLQARLFRMGGVYLLPLVAQVGDTWYESWINPCADEGDGLAELEILAAQSRIVFLIYDGTSLEPGHTVQVPNHLAGELNEMLQRLEGATPWTTEGFAAAREELYAAYPTPRDLIYGPDVF